MSDRTTCHRYPTCEASANHSQDDEQSDQTDQDRQCDQTATAWVHGQGAPPSVSKSPSPSTAEGGTSVGSISSSIGGGVTVFVGLGVLLAVGVGLAEVAVGVADCVVGACVVGACVVGVGVGVAETERVAEGVALGEGSGSSDPLRAAHKAPAPRPSAIAIRTASTIGHREAFGSSGGCSGSCAGGMAMVG